MARSDRRTQREAIEEVFADVSIDFSRNPVTGQLARVVNEEAVKSAVRNVVLAMRGEWPHHPTLGSKVYRMLFEPLDDITADMIKTTIEQSIRTHEPRAQLLGVEVAPEPTQDGYRITVYFRLQNQTQVHTVDELLKRVR